MTSDSRLRLGVIAGGGLLVLAGFSIWYSTLPGWGDLEGTWISRAVKGKVERQAPDRGPFSFSDDAPPEERVGRKNPNPVTYVEKVYLPERRLEIAPGLFDGKTAEFVGKRGDSYVIRLDYYDDGRRIRDDVVVRIDFNGNLIHENRSYQRQ